MAEEYKLKLEADVEALQKSLDDVKESLEENGKAAEASNSKLAGGLKKVSKGFKGVGLAMKAMGIGLVIEAFNFLKEIMMQNQTVIDGVAIATETMGVLFNQITSVVTDVFNAVSKSSEGFEGLQKVISGLMTIAITPLKLAFYGIILAAQEAQLAWEESFLGDNDPETIKLLNEKLVETRANLTEVVDDVVVAGEQVATNFAEAVVELGSIVTIATEVATEGIKKISIESATATGTALANAKKNAELLEVQRAKQQMQSQLDSELQRQIRDDIRKTFDERIAANDELGRILEEQTAKEKEIVDERVRIAALELSTQKDSIALQTAYEQALLEQLDIEERIAGQRSEQLTNQAALEKELDDARKEIRLSTMSAKEQELEALTQEYNLKIKLAKKAGADELAITKKFEADKKILRQNSVDSQLAAASQLAGALSQLAGDNKELAIAGAIIDTFAGANKAFRQGGTIGFVTAAAVIAAGLANVRNIMQTEVKGSGGGSSASIPSASPIGNTIGQAIPVNANLNDLVNQGNEAPPVQAYVISQEVTDSQEADLYIKTQTVL
jgi:hypothetical protein